LLTEGPWLTVDGLFIGPLTYVTCAGGCLARTAYTEAQFTLIAQGQRGVVTVITNTGQRIGVALSLAGLPEAAKALGTPKP
jgi:invasion protein IalB